MREVTDTALESWRECLRSFNPDPQHPDDEFVILTIAQAIAAASEGNFGVGAVLVNADGGVVQEGHNRVFSPHFRSDLHAEMDVMTRFEEANRGISGMRGYTLYSSLEPCPMCLGRLIISGVNGVYYAALDEPGGMASRMDRLSSEWLDLAEGRDFGQAKCSQLLTDLALEVFMGTVHTNDRRLRQRAGLS